ncbi:MAG: hypothetical protein Q7T96_07030 [Methylobacter sp.]|nr:hypothetical protein [Methylobacter sp.]
MNLTSPINIKAYAIKNPDLSVCREHQRLADLQALQQAQAKKYLGEA